MGCCAHGAKPNARVFFLGGGLSGQSFLGAASWPWPGESHFRRPSQVLGASAVAMRGLQQ
eukprot:10590290-Alexandrium_andersonii.AAC.1